MKTGTIKFDSIPQRLNLALAISLLITCATSLQNLIIGPIGTNVGEAYPEVTERIMLLAFLALWGMKLFIDDNQCLVPSKSSPAFDILFLIASHGALICASAFITKGNLTAWALGCHFFLLFSWNMVAFFMPERSKDIVRWMIMDGLTLVLIAIMFFSGLLNVGNYWFIVLLFSILVFDTACSKTLKSEYLIGREKEVE